MIPLLDLQALIQAHEPHITAAVQRVLSSGTYILGPEGESFEAEFTAWVGTSHAIGVANGTDAIELALRACGVKAGDWVLTVAHTAVATAAAIERAGAHPVFIDVDPQTMVMDPDDLAHVLRELPQSPKAIVPVHLYGHMAPMEAILAVAGTIPVIEDCAQAHGAAIHGKKAGQWGACGTFSFYPTKNLGALGDGGGIVTQDAATADRLRLLRQYGWRVRNNSEIPGVNSRLDEMQAAILKVRLGYLEAENQTRIQRAHRYTQALQDHPLITPPVCRPAHTHVYHQYVIQTSQRASLQAHLTAHGIGHAIHYPIPIHQQMAYQGRLVYPRALPVTEQAAGQILSLPLHPYLAETDQDRVIQVLQEWRP